MTEGMDLKAFVQSTLVQIVAGVQDAQHEIAELRTSAKINPVSVGATHSEPKDVQFDVAVTVTDSKSGGGKVGLKIASFEISGQGDRRFDSQAVSRIRFAVPVAVPCSPAEKFPDSGRHRTANPDYDPYNP